MVPEATAGRNDNPQDHIREENCSFEALSLLRVNDHWTSFSQRCASEEGEGPRMRVQPPDRSDKARDLRQRSTESEALLWEHLRNRRFQGRKFRRQRPIGPYFADFCCEDLRLVVEVDGGSHDNEHAAEYDRERDEYMRQCGFTVVRVRDDDVVQHIDEVKMILANTISRIIFDRVVATNTDRQ